MKKTNTRKLILSGIFLAIGLLLPFITGQIPQIGNMLSPMHFPVFLCAFFCGPWYGGIVGFICPLLRSVIFGMPAIFPNAVGMAFELLSYGIITGLIYQLVKKHSILTIYISLLAGMVGGRIVWGLVQVALVSITGGDALTIEVLLARGVINAIPGIIAQLVLIPIIVAAVERAGINREKQSSRS